MTGLLVAREVDALDDSLHLRGLDEAEQLELDSDLQRVAAGVVSLEHHGIEVVFVVDGADVVDGHVDDLTHDVLAVLLKREKLVHELEEQLVEHAHGQQRVAGVREQVALHGVVADRERDCIKEVARLVEVEVVEQLLAHKQLGLEQLFVELIRLDVGVDGHVMVLEHLVLVNLEQVEGDAVGVVLDGRYKEVHLEGYLLALQEIQGQPELVGHYEYHQDLAGFHELVVRLQEFKDILVAEDQRRVQVVVVLPLVQNQHGHEVS
mmetsp:Transcript_12336/g.19155  ORF Transcript_12336/g.19155 Transcript_12336/m.19155 type:complete len:264 (+) Transcript_12336:112-903(+)